MSTITKVSDLDGAELCYWAAEADELKAIVHWERGIVFVEDETGARIEFNPLTDGNQLVALIEKHSIATLGYRHDEDFNTTIWEAWDTWGDRVRCRMFGDTYPQAVLRAIVASRFGERVGETAENVTE